MGKCLCLIIFSILSLTALAEEALTPYAILQGPASQTTVQFAILVPVSDSVSVQILDEAGREVGFSERRISRDYSKWQVVQVRSENVVADEEYQLVVRSSDGVVVDRREFTAEPSTPTDARVAVISCIADVFHNKWAWRQVESMGPDLVLITGDAVYLDRPGLLTTKAPATERDIWQRHVESRNRVQLYRWPRLVPTASVWDDHDFGFNNALNPWPLAEQSKEIYEAFFPREEIKGSLNHGPGMAMNYHFMGQSFVFLDVRSFQQKEAQGYLYGPQQEHWLESQDLNPTVWLASGSQMFGGYLKKDSYQSNHPEDFIRYLNFLKSLPSKFVFLTGDIHMSEVMRVPSEVLGYETREIVSSSIHSGTFPGRHVVMNWLGYNNPWRLGATSTHNFALLDISSQRDGGVVYRTNLITWRGEVKYSEKYALVPKNQCESLLLSNAVGQLPRTSERL